MDSLALKRKKLELSRVTLAREELEFKIEERLEEVARLQSMVQLQKNKEAELDSEINEITRGDN
jgi:hypothetical protein